MRQILPSTAAYRRTHQTFQFCQRHFYVQQWSTADLISHQVFLSYFFYPLWCDLWTFPFRKTESTFQRKYLFVHDIIIQNHTIITDVGYIFFFVYVMTIIYIVHKTSRGWLCLSDQRVKLTTHSGKFGRIHILVFCCPTRGSHG